MNYDYLTVDNDSDSSVYTILGLKQNLFTCLTAPTSPTGCDIKSHVDFYSFDGTTSPLTPTATDLVSCGYKFGQGQVANSPTEGQCIDSSTSTTCATNASVGNLFCIDMINGEYIQFTSQYTIALYNSVGTRITTYNIAIKQMDDDYMIVENSSGTKELISLRTAISNPIPINITPDASITAQDINSRIVGSTTTPKDLTFPFRLLDLKFGPGQVANSPNDIQCTNSDTSTTCATNANVGNLFCIDMINGEYIQFTSNTGSDKATYPYTITLYDSGGTGITTYNVKINQMDDNYMIVEKSDGTKELISHKAAISDPIAVKIATDDSITISEINARAAGGTINALDLLHPFDLFDLKFGPGQVANSPTEEQCTDSSTSTTCAANADVGNLFCIDMINGEYIQFTSNTGSDKATYPYTITLYDSGGTGITTYNVKINQMDDNYMIVENSSGTKELISHKAAISNPIPVNIVTDGSITISEINARAAGGTINALDLLHPFDLFNLKFGHGQIKYVLSSNTAAETAIAACTTCDICDSTSGLSDWGVIIDAYVQFSVNTDTATNNNYPYKITEYNSAGDVLASPTPVQFTNAGADFIVVKDNDPTDNYNIFSLKTLIPNTQSSFTITGNKNPTASQINTFAAGGSATPLIIDHIYTLKFGTGQVAYANCVQSTCTDGSLHGNPVISNLLGTTLNAGQYVKLTANTDSDKATYPYLIGVYDSTGNLQTTPAQTKVKPLAVNADYLLLDNSNSGDSKAILLGFQANLGSGGLNINTMNSNYADTAEVDHYSLDGVFFLTLLDLKFGPGQVANSPDEASCTDNNASTVCATNASVSNLFGTDMTTGQYIQFTSNTGADKTTYPYTITLYDSGSSTCITYNVKIKQMDDNYMIVEKSDGAKELISHKAAISNPIPINITPDADGITAQDINSRIVGSTTIPLNKLITLFDLKFGIEQVGQHKSNDNLIYTKMLLDIDISACLGCYVKLLPNTGTYAYTVGLYNNDNSLHTPPSQVGVHITSASADYLVIDSKGDSPLHNILGLKANLVNGSPFDWTESNPSIDTINMYSLDGTTTPLTPVGSGSGSGAPTIILSPPSGSSTGPGGFPPGMPGGTVLTCSITNFSSWCGILGQSITLSKFTKVTCSTANCIGGTITRVSGDSGNDLFGTDINSSTITLSTNSGTYPYVITPSTGSAVNVKLLAMSANYLLFDNSDNSDSIAVVIGLNDDDLTSPSFDFSCNNIIC